MTNLFSFFLCLSLWTGSSHQTDPCRFKVTLLKEDKGGVCFSKMKEEACSKITAGTLCLIEEKNGILCIKQTVSDLVCMNDDLEKLPVENAECAKDQTSLDCKREYTDSVNSASPASIFLAGSFFFFLISSLLVVSC
ncbi:uncharacterized protein LOC143509714 [Brachyhypopomus gauderio]|uniref:uncharacterized protein LOC143509714 n=1 Tax=Brachyhypopomus gauderio TaxID=698409 RepID=UPI0040420B73